MFTVIGILVVTLYILAVDKQELRDVSTKNTVDTYLLTRETQETFIADMASYIQTNNELIDAIENKNALSLNSIGSKFANFEEIAYFIMVDANVNILYDSNGRDEYLAGIERVRELEEVMNTNQIYSIGTTGGTSNIHIRATIPIKGRRTNNIVGAVVVATASLNPEKFQSIKEATNEEFMIIKDGKLKNGTLPFESDEIISEEFYNQLINNFYVGEYKLVDVDGVSYYGYFYPTEASGATMIYTALQPRSQLVQVLTSVFIPILIVSIIASIVLGFILVFSIRKQITKPIKHISSVAENLAKGNINVKKVDLKSKDEIGQLNDQFNQLIDRTKYKVEVTQDIAAGELDNVDFYNIEEDLLAQSLETVVHHLNDFKTDIQNSSVNIISGLLSETIDSTKYNGAYKEIIEGINLIVKSYVHLIDEMATSIFTFDKNGKVLYANRITSNIAKKSISDLVGLQSSSEFKTYDDEYFENGYLSVINTGEALTHEAILNDEYKIDYLSRPLFDNNNNIIGGITTLVDQTEIRNSEEKLKKESDYQQKEVNRLLENISLLSEGKFNLDFTPYEADEDIKELNDTFNTINSNLEFSVKSIENIISELGYVLNELSNSNLDIQTNENYVGDFKTIENALNKIIDSFNDVVMDIMKTAQVVTTNSHSVHESSQSLSRGATEQAAAIEEISATVTQVAAQVKENALSASKVQENALGTEVKAETSNQQMTQLVESMNEIEKSTNNIQKVLKMINDIAFQTNILSLNAAVEAARAGQHGKGFAVIAEDVRNLALKSATAADETSEMLEDIINKISDSATFAKETAESLGGIVISSKESVQISSEVANASNEQSSAIGQITLSLDQISQVVQQTSANATNNVTISDDLSDSANHLIESVSQFKLKGEALELKSIKKRKEKSQEYTSDDALIIDLDEF
jgi:methyl-accepting chemotaxis protein